MKSTQISSAQLVFLLFLYHSFNMFTAEAHNVTGNYGLPHLLAIPAAVLLQALVVLPAWILAWKCRRGPAEAALWTMGKAGVIYPLASSLYLLWVMAFTVYSMSDFMVNAIYPGSARMFFIVTMILGALYAAYLGLEGIARAAFIIFALFLLSLLLTFGGVMDRAHLINIHPFPDHSFQLVMEGAWKIMSRSSGIVIYLLLLPYVGSHKKRGFWITLASIAALMEAVTFLVSSVLGDLGRTEAYPFFMLTTVAEVSILQRMDALHVAVWVMVSFLRITLCLWLVRQQLLLCLPLKQQAAKNKWLLPVLAAIALLLAAAMNENRDLSSQTLAVFTTGVPILLLGAVFPLVCLIAGGIRKRLIPKNQEGGES